MNYQTNPFRPVTPSFSTILRRFFFQKSILNRLIIINISVYACYLILLLFNNLTTFLFTGDANINFVNLITHYLSCPADYHQLWHQPWSIITSIFFHTSFWHIFFNMVMLYVIGKIFLSYLTENTLLITYLVGGVAGNIFYILSYNLFPVFAGDLPYATALGASGGIMAIIGAITIYQPNHTINLLLFGRIRLLWLTLIFLGIDLLSIPHGNAGGHIAHLGGAIYGAISALFYLKFPHIHFNRFSKEQKKQKKVKFYTSYDNSSSRPLSDEEYNSRKVEQQKELDKILDKISQNGYEALSQEEKEYLFYSSKKQQ